MLLPRFNPKVFSTSPAPTKLLTNQSRALTTCAGQLRASGEPQETSLKMSRLQAERPCMEGGIPYWHRGTWTWWRVDRYWAESQR